MSASPTHSSSRLLQLCSATLETLILRDTCDGIRLSNLVRPAEMPLLAKIVLNVYEHRFPNNRDTLINLVKAINKWNVSVELRVLMWKSTRKSQDLVQHPEIDAFAQRCKSELRGTKCDVCMVYVDRG